MLSCTDHKAALTLPPLLAFQWVGGITPTLAQEIRISANSIQKMYTLRGVIHFAQNHFTAHVRVASGTWFHNGMVTGRSLVWQPLQDHHLSTTVCAIYSQLPTL